ncbi:MAG TPA: histone deacetylase [Planctomycetaceae bacterium]|nr:histone deacetylase [Planctomycetaceae bacterium]
MKLFTTDLFVLPLPPGHRFPMIRYRLLRERLQQCGLFQPDDFEVPPAASEQQLQLVHTADWVRRVLSGELTGDEIRRIGFPWSLQMVERCRRSTGATVAASRAALRDAVAVNLAGGTHHAFPDRGAGYCVFNDVAVAARSMQQEQRIQRALVLDGDVHQGDGTAAIFADDPSVRTFSLHAAKAFPVRKMRSDFDIELPPGTTDNDYLAAWQEGLHWAAQQERPDLVYFVAGADPYVGDTLGGLAVSKSGLQTRDNLVFEFCTRQQCPLVVVMAGGYAESVNDIVDIQFHTVTAAASLQQA